MYKILSFAILPILVNTINLSAQDQAAQSGTFEIETAENKKSYDYKQYQEDSIAYVDKLKTDLTLLKEGTLNSQPELTLPLANHLAASYLECSLKRGVCPIFLDTILETDIINSKINSKAECPNMKKFWKVWIENDMQKRIGLSVKTGMLSKTENFNKSELPRFIKCVDTIEKILNNNSTKTPAEFFKERYADGSKIPAYVMTTKKYLEIIKLKIPNIFIAVGMETPK